MPSKGLLCLVMLTCCFALLQAQTPRRNGNDLTITDVQSQAIQVLPSQALIWEVRRSDLAYTSYIFGILYKVPNDWFFLPPGLSPIVESCNRLLLEADPKPVDKDVLYRGAVSIDSTLFTLVPRKEAKEIQLFFQDSLSALSRYKLENRYKPILVMQQMMQDIVLGYRETDEPISYEQYLARSSRKPIKILGAEWTREAWVDAISVQEQTAILLDAYHNRHRLKVQYEELMRAYRRQDLDAVQYMADRAPDLGGGTGRLVEAKNMAWIQPIEWYMQKESVFIAVNAAQLPGETGLLHMLRKRGYSVTPVIY